MAGKWIVLALVAAMACAQGDEVSVQIRTRPIAIIAFSDGEQVVLGFVSRAPVSCPSILSLAQKLTFVSAVPTTAKRLPFAHRCHANAGHV